MVWSHSRTGSVASGYAYKQWQCVYALTGVLLLVALLTLLVLRLPGGELGAPDASPFPFPTVGDLEAEGAFDFGVEGDLGTFGVEGPGLGPSKSVGKSKSVGPSMLGSELGGEVGLGLGPAWFPTLTPGANLMVSWVPHLLVQKPSDVEMGCSFICIHAVRDSSVPQGSTVVMNEYHADCSFSNKISWVGRIDT